MVLEYVKLVLLALSNIIIHSKKYHVTTTIYEKIMGDIKFRKLARDIEKNRLKWFGHLTRMEKGKLPQKC